MAYKIKYVASARQDMLDIALHLSRFYESTFPKFIARLDRSVARLVDMPYMGIAYRNYRRLVVGDYLVFYQVDEAGRTIQIYRILHGAQDVSAIQAGL